MKYVIYFEYLKNARDQSRLEKKVLSELILPRKLNRDDMTTFFELNLNCTRLPKK